MAGRDWIAVDWGTSHLRLWHVGADGAVLAKRDSADGMGTLDRAGFEPALTALLPERDGGALPVLVCGMAGSRQGWTEAPYLTVPCAPPDASQAAKVATDDPGLAVRILPGLRQTDPADVMRGEETQVAGFLALNPRFDGVLCLPGTHSKWVHVSAGEIVSFRTFMTGELFALLGTRSVLRHSVADSGWDDDAFAAAVTRALSTPASVSADLFTLRAESLLTGLPAETARARLSGLLIGLELAAAKPYWLGQNVALLGATALCAPYRAALEAQGVPVLVADGERMVLEGLKRARTTSEKEQT